MNKTNFDWHCIFYSASFFIFYHGDYHLEKHFIKPCLFHQGYKLWGYIPLGPSFLIHLGPYTMPFPLWLYLNIGHYCKFLSLAYIANASYIWKQSLKGVPSNMFPLKLGKPDTLTKDTNTLQMTGKMNIITYIKKILPS